MVHSDVQLGLPCPVLPGPARRFIAGAGFFTYMAEGAYSAPHPAPPSASSSLCGPLCTSRVVYPVCRSVSDGGDPIRPQSDWPWCPSRLCHLVCVRPPPVLAGCNALPPSAWSSAVVRSARHPPMAGGSLRAASGSTWLRPRATFACCFPCAARTPTQGPYPFRTAPSHGRVHPFPVPL